MFRTTCVGLLACFLATAGAAAERTSWGGLPVGPHAVGFELRDDLDFSRAPLGDQAVWPPHLRRGRTMQVGLWYPARAGRTGPMTLTDYLELVGRTPAADRDSAHKVVVAGVSQATGLSPLSVERLITRRVPMKAFRGAHAASGSFPVVVAIHGEVWDYALLGEFLASHGYIVVSPAMSGTFSKSFDEISKGGVQTSLDDARWALAQAARRPDADLGRVAVVGQSFGAMGAVALALRDSRVKAVVSLDGGIGTPFGSQVLLDMPSYDPLRIDRPLFHLWAPHPDVDLSAIRDYKYAPRLLWQFEGLRHADFVACGHVEDFAPGETAQLLGPPKSDRNQQLQRAYDAVRGFLEAALSTEPARRLEVFASAARADSAEYRPSISKPPALSELTRMLRDEGYQALARVLDRQRAIDPEPFPRTTFQSLWQELNGRGLHEDALSWGGEFQSIYPASAVARYVIARSEAALGLKEQARRSFEQSLSMLEADPSLSEQERELYRAGAGRRMSEL